MTILDKIIAYKHKEVSVKKEVFPISILEQSKYFKRETKSLSKALQNGSGIIAEHKRKSPSKSVINDTNKVDDVVTGYENSGVSGMSILTDTTFFGGSLDDLLVARNSVSTPLLRKEFIIDPYQIFEAKSYGADAILLIAAYLSQKQLTEYSEIATQLGLEVLLEVHNEEELKKSIIPNVSMIGTNNRNLKTFEVSIETSKQLASKIPEGYVKVSESGINSISAIQELKQYGYKGFLIGENFMKTDNPGEAAKKFIEQLLK